MPHNLKLHGVIGDWWDHNDSKAVTEEIDAIEDGEEIEVHLNSPGGDAFDGVAIFNALRNHDGPVTVYVDALAASAASLIAMAGDTVIMGLGAMLMVHNPWMLTAGDADDHRKNAEMLDKLRDSYVSAYTSKTGKDADDLNAMLEDETWLTAEEAVAEGFADEVDDGADEEQAAAAMAAFDFKGFNKIPDDVRDRVAAAVHSRPAASIQPPTRADDMKIENTQETGAQAAADSQPEGAAPATQGFTQDDLAKAAARAREDEQKRQAEIRRACAAANLPGEFADSLVSETVDGKPLTELEAYRRVHAKLAEEQAQPAANVVASITAGLDERDKFRDGAEKALMARIGRGERDPQNPFNSFSLKEMARHSAVLAGADQGRFRSSMDVAGAGFRPQAYGGQTTSDFPLILENVIAKEMLRGWEENEETFGTWTRTGSLPDFKIAKRTGLNLFDDLDEIPEGGKYEHGSLTDRGESISLATYGRKFALTRQAIINDDISAFTLVPMRMGRAAARTIANLAYAVVTGNPDLSDGTALFSSADRGNSTNTALGIDSITKARVAMATMKDPDDKAESGLNIRPKFLLVPVALESEAKVLMESEKVPGSGDNDVNPVRGMLQIVSDARLDADSTSKHYVLADPNVYDTVEVAYLNGVQTPTLEQKDGWDVDGVEFKIRHDAGVKALDYRGMYRAGA